MVRWTKKFIWDVMYPVLDLSRGYFVFFLFFVNVIVFIFILFLFSENFLG